MTSHFEHHNMPTEHRQQHQIGGRGDSTVASSTASPLLPTSLATVPDVVMDAATSVGQHQSQQLLQETQQKFHSPIDSDGWPIPATVGGDGMLSASMVPVKPPLIPVEFASDTTLTPEERLQFAQAVAPNNPHKSELVFPWTRAQVQSHLNITQLLNAPLQSYGNAAFSAAANWQYAAAAQQQQHQQQHQQQQNFYSHLRGSVTPNATGIDDGSHQKSFSHHASSSSVTSPGVGNDQVPIGVISDNNTSSSGGAYYFSGFAPQQQQQDQSYIRYPYNQPRVPGYHAPTTGFLPRVNANSGNNNNFYQQQLYDSPSHAYGGEQENGVIGGDVGQQLQQDYQQEYPATLRHAADDTVDNNSNTQRPSVPGGPESTKKFDDDSTPAASSQPGNWASAASGGKKSPRRPPSTNKNSASGGPAVDKSTTNAVNAAEDNTASSGELSYERTPSDLQQQPNEFGDWEGGVDNNLHAKKLAESRASSSHSNHARVHATTSSGLPPATNNGSGKVSAARTRSSETSSPHPSSTPDTMSTVTTRMENQQSVTPLASTGGVAADLAGTPTNTAATASATAPSGGTKPFNYAAMLKKDVLGGKHPRVGVKGSGKVEVIPASAAVGFSAVGGPISAAGPLLSSTEKVEQQSSDQQLQPQPQQQGGNRVVQMSVGDYAKLGQLFSSLEPLRTLRLSQSRGMRNTGTACYMNAVLQVLIACPQFANVLMSAERNIFNFSLGLGGSSSGNTTASSGAAANSSVRCEIAKMPAFSALLWLWRQGKPPLSVRVQQQHASREATFNNLAGPIGFNQSLGGSTVSKPSNEPAIDPMPFYDKLKDVGIMPYTKGQHQDAQEFYGALLNRLHEEMSEAIKFAKEYDEQQSRGGGAGHLPSSPAASQQPQAKGSAIPSAAGGPSSAALLASGTGGGISVNSSISSDVDGGSDTTEWNTVGKKGRVGMHRDYKMVETPIYKIFGGMRVNSVASGSKEPSSAAEPFYQLNLYIQSTNPVDNVQQALTNLFLKEPVQGYKRSDGRESNASSALHLQDLPLVLVLNVLYAEYDGLARETRKFATPKPLYVSADIAFDVKHFTKEALINKSKPYGTNEESRKFKLMAAVYHVGGGASRGHFVALAFNMEVHGCWMLLDDEKVYTGNYKELVEEHLSISRQQAVPYLLFYRRNDTMAGPSGPKGGGKPWQQADGNGGAKGYNGTVSGGGQRSAGSAKQREGGGFNRSRE